MGGNQILTSMVKLKWHPHTATSELRKQRARFAAGRKQTPCPEREEQSAFSMPMAFQGLRNCQETFRFPGRIRTFLRPVPEY